MFIWVLRLAPVMFLVNAMIIGLLTTGYSAQRSTISSLVHGKLGSWQTANFLICGILILGLTYYFRAFDNTNIANVHLVKVGALVLGLSLVLLGLLPSDRVGHTTLVGQIHGAIFIISVLTQASLQLLVALSNVPSAIFWYLLVSSIITAAGLLMMFLVPDMRGISQRILVGAIMLWVTVGSFWLSA